MNKDYFIKLAKEKLDNNTRELYIKQIENYFEAKENYKLDEHKYEVGDLVYLKKRTILHGTYKNMEGLELIAKQGLICDIEIEGRGTKYPHTVGVWNLKQDYYLKDYINFYSGGTIEYRKEDYKKTEVIPLDKMNNIIELIKNEKKHIWRMQQTKEARFMPSCQQENVQVGIIFDGNSKYMDNILKYDILSSDISDSDVKPFINELYYERFLTERKDKDDFFTDRESAIIFGIPSCFIQGVLVGRIYENDEEKLNKIKELLPQAYICNLDGVVIRK